MTMVEGVMDPMKGGKHYCEFILNKTTSYNVMFGVVDSSLDATTCGM